MEEGEHNSEIKSDEESSFFSSIRKNKSGFKEEEDDLQSTSRFDSEYINFAMEDGFKEINQSSSQINQLTQNEGQEQGNLFRNLEEENMNLRIINRQLEELLLNEQLLRVQQTHKIETELKQELLSQRETFEKIIKGMKEQLFLQKTADEAASYQQSVKISRFEREIERLMKEVNRNKCNNSCNEKKKEVLKENVNNASLIGRQSTNRDREQSVNKSRTIDYYRRDSLNFSKEENASKFQKVQDSLYLNSWKISPKSPIFNSQKILQDNDVEMDLKKTYSFEKHFAQLREQNMADSKQMVNEKHVVSQVLLESFPNSNNKSEVKYYDSSNCKRLDDLLKDKCFTSSNHHISIKNNTPRYETQSTENLNLFRANQTDQRQMNNKSGQNKRSNCSYKYIFKDEEESITKQRESNPSLLKACNDYQLVRLSNFTSQEDLQSPQSLLKYYEQFKQKSEIEENSSYHNNHIIKNHDYLLTFQNEGNSTLLPKSEESYSRFNEKRDYINQQQSNCMQKHNSCSDVAYSSTNNISQASNIDLKNQLQYNIDSSQLKQQSFNQRAQSLQCSRKNSNSIETCSTFSNIDFITDKRYNSKRRNSSCVSQSNPVSSKQREYKREIVCKQEDINVTQKGNKVMQQLKQNTSNNNSKLSQKKQSQCFKSVKTQQAQAQASTFFDQKKPKQRNSSCNPAKLAKNIKNSFPHQAPRSQYLLQQSFS